MRNGACTGSFLRKSSRSRRVLGLATVALLAGLSRLELAGQNIGTYLARLLVSPADAGKSSSRLARTGGFHGRQSSAGSHIQQFLPFRQLPSPRPAPTPSASPPTSPSIQMVRLPPGTHPAPDFFGVAPTVWSPPGSSNSIGPGGDVPRPTAHEVAARWDTTIRPGALTREAERLAPFLHATQLTPGQQRRLASPHLRSHLERLHLEKLSGRRQPSKGTTAPPAATPGAGRDIAAGEAKPAPRRLGRRIIGELLPPVGSYRSNEVLAVNLSPEGLARARENNYQLVGRIDLPEFGLILSRLRPPDTLNAVKGRERLFELLPKEGFTLNRFYASYRPSAGDGGATASVAAQSGGCPAERCFGGALINWQPRLAACASGVKIGILDTGFDEDHPAFAGVRYLYQEFVPEGSERAPDQHGTGVLSLLAGNAGSGPPGLIPGASYVIANAFFADAGGQPVSDTAQMLLALHWLKKNGVAVVNLSIAGPEDELLHHAVQELTEAGTVVVAAAGNEGPAAPPSYPAAYDEVIAVTAVDRDLAPYRYANRGDQIDLSAPGVDVWTALPGGRQGPQTGTSFAVPYVTAVVAVALPQSGLVPNDDPVAVKRRMLAQLEGNVRSLNSHGRDPVFGAGLVQAPASCGPPPAVAVAANAARAGVQPSASTMVRVAKPAPRDPLVLGTWVSTVRSVSGEALPR
ncbi:MAG: S8 family serine peptidase [Hyphomicrobiaceae bacterium]|nr:S8 family serine peptidase [Hyphomicrobiaceae bacterium]